MTDRFCIGTLPALCCRKAGGRRWRRRSNGQARAAALPACPAGLSAGFAFRSLPHAVSVSCASALAQDSFPPGGGVGQGGMLCNALARPRGGDGGEFPAVEPRQYAARPRALVRSDNLRASRHRDAVLARRRLHQRVLLRAFPPVAPPAEIPRHRVLSVLPNRGVCRFLSRVHRHNRSST